MASRPPRGTTALTGPRPATARRADAAPRGATVAPRRQQVAYLAASAATALVYYALLGLALYVTDGEISYLLLAAAAHLVTVLLVYPVYRLAVFRTHDRPWVTGYLRFYAVGLGFLGLSLAGLPLLVHVLGLSVLAAQALILLVSPAATYVVHRAWTFATVDRSTSPSPAIGRSSDQFPHR